jgi:hypothetical protein
LLLAVEKGVGGTVERSDRGCGWVRVGRNKTGRMNAVIAGGVKERKNRDGFVSVSPL